MSSDYNNTNNIVNNKFCYDTFQYDNNLIRELTNKLENDMENLNLNNNYSKILKEINYNFTKYPNNFYYLYLHYDGFYFLSLLSPNDWKYFGLYKAKFICNDNLEFILVED